MEVIMKNTTKQLLKDMIRSKEFIGTVSVIIGSGVLCAFLPNIPKEPVVILEASLLAGIGANAAVDCLAKEELETPPLQRQVLPRYVSNEKEKVYQKKDK